MTAGQDPVAAVVARRVREIRDRRGWSGAVLAERMAAAGLPQFDRGVIANFESGRRRSVSIDEVLVLALVLDVAPLDLFVPVDGDRVDDLVGGEVEPGLVRAWVRGTQPLPGQNTRTFRTEVPDEEWEAFEERGATAGEIDRATFHARRTADELELRRLAR